MSEVSSRELLERLIGFATVSRDSNLELIAFIQHYLAELGVESELFLQPGAHQGQPVRHHRPL